MQDLTPPKLTPMKGALLGRIVGAVTRRPLTVLALTAVLALGGAALALRLEPSVATDTLVDSGSDSFQATERFKRDFGDEAVLVLVRGELTRTVLTQDLGRVLRLEGCLSGNVPEKGLRDLPDVCRELAELKPAKAVYGPGTFINTAATQIAGQFAAEERANRRQAQRAAAAARRLSERRGDPPAEQERLARAASEAVRAQFVQSAIQLGLRYGLTDVPRVDDPSFVSALVFDTRAGDVGVPKSRFAYLFPSKNAALIQVRMRPDLSEEQRRRAIALIEEATGERAFRPPAGRALHRDRRAGGDRGPRRRRAELDLRAARRGAAADGGHARARLPLSPAACCRSRSHWRPLR